MYCIVPINCMLVMSFVWGYPFGYSYFLLTQDCLEAFFLSFFELEFLNLISFRFLYYMLTLYLEFLFFFGSYKQMIEYSAQDFNSPWAREYTYHCKLYICNDVLTYLSATTRIRPMISFHRGFSKVK